MSRKEIPQQNLDAFVDVLGKNIDPDARYTDKIELAVRAAFERLKNGSTADADFDRVGSALNVARVRAEMIGAGPLIDATRAKKIKRDTPIHELLQLSYLLDESLRNATVWTDAIDQAMQAMTRCDDRKETTGAYGFTGPDLVAMNEAMSCYSQILALSTPASMEAASQEAYRRWTVAQP